MSVTPITLRNHPAGSPETAEFVNKLEALFPDMLDEPLGYEWRQKMNRLLGVDVQNGPPRNVLLAYLPRLRELSGDAQPAA